MSLESCASVVYYYPHTTTLGVAVGVNIKERADGTSSMKNSMVMVVLGVGAAMVAGCAGAVTTVRPDGRGAEVRGSATVAAGAARPLVAGPIRLLHANSDGRVAPKFSRVWVISGAEDCRNATPLEWDGTSAVQIQKDEMVCVQTARSTRVSWHGRAVQATGPAMLRQASLR